MKTNAERTIEALTWAAVVIWLGFALIAHILGYAWLVVMVLGIILLSSALYQRSRGWHTALSLWIAGIWMAVFSVVAIVDELVGAINNDGGLGIDLWVYLGIALVSMGVAVVFRHTQGPGVVTEGRTSSRQREQRSYERRPQVPRRVQEDMSSGWTEPSRQARSQQQPSWQESPRQEPRRTSSGRRRSARPVEEPSDLESRVENIIRRSREKRERDDLPY
jgi:hypothetical protein